VPDFRLVQRRTTSDAGANDHLHYGDSFAQDFVDSTCTQLITTTFTYEETAHAGTWLAPVPLSNHDVRGEKSMIATRRRIGTLITTIQQAFLDTPGLVLTLPAAIQQFATDPLTCEALLTVLVDAGVLTKEPGGVYVRRFPRRRLRDVNVVKHAGRRAQRSGRAPQAA
jgi:hypothetical protein